MLLVQQREFLGHSFLPCVPSSRKAKSSSYMRVLCNPTCTRQVVEGQHESGLKSPVCVPQEHFRGTYSSEVFNTPLPALGDENISCEAGFLGKPFGSAHKDMSKHGLECVLKVWCQREYIMLSTYQLKCLSETQSLQWYVCRERVIYRQRERER